MPQNPLNDDVRHPEAVKVAPEATASRVPAMPLGNTSIPRKGVRGVLVFSVILAALPESRENCAINEGAQRD